MTTLAQPVLDYRLLGGHQEGLSFLDSRGVTGGLRYADLAQQARRAAGALSARGVRFQDRVLLPMPTGPAYFTALAGCLLGGFVPCTVVSPPNPEDPRSPGMRQFAAVVSAVGPAAVIAPDEATARALAAIAGPVYLTPAELDGDPATQPAAPRPNDLHHIQLTSGSTSAPRAAALTYAQVTANVTALTEAFELHRHPGGDRICNWLPLHHDMGFVVALTALHSGTPLDLMTPIGFVRDPLSWLRHISERRATITSAPPFGYRSAADRHRRTPLAELDLSSLRQAHVGAEPIPFPVLTDFRDAFAPHGLDESALIPCYGMAETVLASTMSLARRPSAELSWGRVKALRLDRSELHHHNRVTDARDGRPDITVVACGRPVGGLEIEVRRPDGGGCAENEIGEVHLRGDSVMAGYLGPDGAPRPVDARTHATGDLGFQRDGDLYIVGRLKEMLIVRGRNLPPYDVEQAIEAHPDIEAGNSAVFSHTDDSGEQVVAVVESKARGEAAARIKGEVAMLVRQAFGFTPREVVVVRRGRIPRTTSGKRQRAKLRERYTAGELT
ncbi:AMP-binding protein [Streptomyces palmae]|uniref:AMP-binding protein n=1 Tax=Streptomyces palmae TaxID=1701085 RepID=UPI0014333D3B|nr:AMP-binding protein [Streptomyces palmae]